MDIFRERLKELREEYDLDQRKMGELLNISTSAYGYYEQGRNEPSLETLAKISQKFNVSTDYLLGVSSTRKAPVYYDISDDVSLSKSELETINKMKKLSLLSEISEKPEKNVETLNRYWQFIKNEQSIKD
ncbi:helix-turn-helix domain-containing protein [Virgibacillus sp. W0181]|uniref:helix-turn-helix domain-containing protein n=1 Tax=Virgibacillus sp. W0181 TaxID=3391581 RepID=UPI003F47D78A